MKHVNMVQTPVDAEKSLDSKQQEWMVDFIKKEMTKLIKGKHVANDSNFVNFPHTNEFSGMATESRFLGGKCDYQIVDIGASVHICSNPNMFEKFKTLSTYTIVHLMEG